MEIRFWAAVLLLAAGTSASAQDVRPSAQDARSSTLIPAADLLLPHGSGGLVANSAFTPASNADAAHSAFNGTLVLTETEMTTVPGTLVSRSVLGRDPAIFPGVALSFFTDKGDLVPLTQEVIRVGSTGRGRSFWDLIVQPAACGRNRRTARGSRAAFPFALVNSIEGETHNGVATFLYRPGKVSNLRFQIVQQTAPFYVKDYFTAAGSAPATFAPVMRGDIVSLMRQYESSLADAVRVSTWSELAGKVGGAALSGFDDKMPVDDIVLSGLDYEGVFYLKQCRSAAGPLPWCDRARFGVWSATKALANETALLRLAQKYGPGVFDLKIADYVTEAAHHPGWANVRFEDAIDMATGLGSGSSKRDPNNIGDGYLTGGYGRWYEARSVREKVNALLDERVYPWGPGKVVRYRDQDMFVLGLAMNNFLKSKEGPSADIWSMLEKEVFEPIGIHYAPTNRTLEPDGSPGQPMMAYGYYPTIGDMVLIARLYQRGGETGRYANPVCTPRRLAARRPRAAWSADRRETSVRRDDLQQCVLDRAIPVGRRLPPVLSADDRLGR